MKHIPLTQGKFALVDDEDYDWLMQWKWQARKSDRTYYAVRTCLCWLPGVANRHTIRMHRVIMNVPQEMQIDHINHDGLDNCKGNLRICTNTENRYNSKPRSHRSSKYKGVTLSTSRPKGVWRCWQSRIGNKNIKHHLGSYYTQEEAADAYDQKAKILFGEFAYINNAKKGLKNGQK